MKGAKRNKSCQDKNRKGCHCLSCDLDTENQARKKKREIQDIIFEEQLNEVERNK